MKRAKRLSINTRVQGSRTVLSLIQSFLSVFLCVRVAHACMPVFVFVRVRACVCAQTTLHPLASDSIRVSC